MTKHTVRNHQNNNTNLPPTAEILL